MVVALEITEFSFSSPPYIKSFDVEFEVGATDIDKEYFLVQGNTSDTSFGYFCRKEKQYELSLIDGGAHKIYTAPVVDDQLKFSWPIYSINNVRMTLVLEQGDVSMDHVSSCHFLSSVLSITTVRTPNVEPVYSCEEKCDYYYLIIPFVVCVLGSRYDLLLNLYRNRQGLQEIEELEESTV